MPDADNDFDSQDEAEVYDETHGLDEDPTGADPDDVFDDRVDLEASARRELLEETGLLAAEIVGGTKVNRCEDIEQDPISKDMYFALTGNPERGDKFGSLLRIKEKNSDPLSHEFESGTFLMGGKELGFAYPDNLEFDELRRERFRFRFD